MRSRTLAGVARRFFSSQKPDPKILESSRVPSNQFERIYHYGSLVTSMGLGALVESMKRLASNDKKSGSVFLSEQNMELLVRKLSRMRGAALKIGQLISFQDDKVVPKEIQTVMSRLQSRANYMPRKQLDGVIKKGLGPNWRDLFTEFQEKPIAAASIGQVHRAVLKSNGKEVAVKVQYPGVANSIDSDLNTIALLLFGSRLLPEGLFLDKTIENAREELAWECDYVREADNIKKFRELLSGESFCRIPEVYDEASSDQVLTMEYLPGYELNRIESLSQKERDDICTAIMRLCLREIADFKFMQTDPNWANFLYDPESKVLSLLDFGASRAYGDEFIHDYLEVLKAAVRGDKQKCEDYSLKLGYLTGLESPAMKAAHVDSIMVLAEPFSNEGAYDFKTQTVTDRVRNNISLMLRERLSPPPEETYGLHRKLSGVFLLCARLGATVPCSQLFAEIVGK